MDRFFEFEKAKLFDTWKRARNNKYSNPKFEAFHNFFKAFYEKIKNENVASLTETQKICLKKAMSYFQERVNCLSNNTATNAPYEVVESIKLAAKTWVPDIDNYVILTRYGDYSFSYHMEEDAILTYIENDYSIHFDYKTVLLAIPQHYYRDYLNNVVLYHEIGHFVDTINRITDIAVNDTINHIITKRNLDEILQVFPFLSNKDIPYQYFLDHHFKEYFADIFAASFIGRNINKYLKYLSYPKTETEDYSPTHPSNKLRFKMIDEFLQGKNNYVIDMIQYILGKKGLPNLCKISSSINASDLYRLLPVKLSTDHDIHALYSLAWDVWDGDRSRFKSENNMSFDLQPTQLYTILNNLVEKSISNYLIECQSQYWLRLNISHRAQTT